MRREPLDARADIYSVGATLHYILKVKCQNAEDPAAFKKSRDFQAVLAVATRAMQTSPEQRYQSAEELLRALKRIHPQYRRQIALRMLGAVAFSALVAGMLVCCSDVHSHLQPPPPQPAPLSGSEKWNDWLSSVAGDHLPAGLQRTPDGVLATETTWFTCGPAMQNQALRIVYRTPRVIKTTGQSKAHLQLFLRSTEDGRDSFGANAYLNEWLLVHRRRGEEFKILRKVKNAPDDLVEGDRTAELKMVEGVLTFSRGYREVTIADLPAGEKGVPAILCSAGILFKKIEWRELPRE